MPVKEGKQPDVSSMRMGEVETLEWWGEASPPVILRLFIRQCSQALGRALIDHSSATTLWGNIVLAREELKELDKKYWDLVERHKALQLELIALKKEAKGKNSIAGLSDAES